MIINTSFYHQFNEEKPKPPSSLLNTQNSWKERIKHISFYH